MATIYITEVEIVNDPRSVLAGLRAGDEYVIDGVKPLTIRAADEPRRFRTLDESIAIAKQLEAERGYPLRMGKEFADDLEEIVASRKPRKSAWD